MTQPEQTLAEILHRSARALAGYAAGEAASPEPDPAVAGAPFDGWQNVLTARLEELAIAIAARQPEYFVDQVRWARTALEVRGVPAASLRLYLEALRRVLAEQLPAELAPRATDVIDRALAGFAGGPAGMSSRLTAATTDQRRAAEYLVAILEGDRREAARLILAEADAGRDLAELYLEVLQPAQEELGRMWLLGEINVAEEHFATNTTRWVMAQLQARRPSRAANGKTAVAAAVAGNQHDLGIQMVADLLEDHGWRVISLGANVPAEDLAEAVEFYAADLVALSASLPTHLPALEEAVRAVRGSDRGAAVKVLVGGRGMAAFAELLRSRGIDSAAADARDAVVQANALVGLA